MDDLTPPGEPGEAAERASGGIEGPRFEALGWEGGLNEPPLLDDDDLDDDGAGTDWPRFTTGKPDEPEDEDLPAAPVVPLHSADGDPGPEDEEPF